MRTTGVRVAPQPAPRSAPGHPLPLPRTKFYHHQKEEEEEEIQKQQQYLTSPTLTILSQQALPNDDHHLQDESSSSGEDEETRVRDASTTPESPAQSSPAPQPTTTPSQFSQPQTSPPSQCSTPQPSSLQSSSLHHSSIHSSFPQPTSLQPSSSQPTSLQPSLPQTNSLQQSSLQPSPAQSTKLSPCRPPPKPPRTFSHRSPSGDGLVRSSALRRSDGGGGGGGGGERRWLPAGARATAFVPRPGLMSVLSPRSSASPSTPPTDSLSSSPSATSSGTPPASLSSLSPSTSTSSPAVPPSLPSPQHTARQPASLSPGINSHPSHPGASQPPAMTSRPPPSLPVRPSSALISSRCSQGRRAGSDEVDAPRAPPMALPREQLPRLQEPPTRAQEPLTRPRERPARPQPPSTRPQQPPSRPLSRPVPPPAVRSAPPAPSPSPRLQQEPVFSVEEFEDVCKEVFKHRKAAVKQAAAGKYVQAASHYQMALAAMDRVLGTQVLTLTTREATRQKLFILQQDVFTLRKELLHGFTDAQTAIETPPGLTPTSNSSPGAPPSYDEVLKEDRQRRKQDVSPPLPTRQPSMRGPASDFTRPSQPRQRSRHHRQERSSDIEPSSCRTSHHSSLPENQIQPPARPVVDSESQQVRPLHSQADVSQSRPKVSQPRQQVNTSSPSNTLPAGQQVWNSTPQVPDSRPQQNISRPRPRPQQSTSAHQVRPSSAIGGKSSQVETLVDVLGDRGGGGRNHVPSTPGSAPPDLTSRPLLLPTPATSTTQPPTRPKSYHPGCNSLISPMTPSPASLTPMPSAIGNQISSLSTQPTSLTLQASSLNTQLSSITTRPSSLSIQSSSFNAMPSSSSTTLLSFPSLPPSTTTRSLNQAPTSITSPTFPIPEEIVQSQLDAFNLYQTKRTSTQHPLGNPPSQIHTHSSQSDTPPPLPDRPPPLPDCPPPSSPEESSGVQFKFGVFNRASSTSTSGYSSSSTIFSPKPVIVDPFATLDPFPPVKPAELESDDAFFDSPSPSSLVQANQSTGNKDSPVFSLVDPGSNSGHPPNNSDHPVGSGNGGERQKAKTNDVVDSKLVDPQNSNGDGGDNILEALDFAVDQSHPRVTPRRSGSIRARCYSQETLLDHSFRTLDAVLNQDKAINASRASIIEEFDPLASMWPNQEEVREGVAEVAIPQENLEGAITHQDSRDGQLALQDTSPEEGRHVSQDKPDEEPFTSQDILKEQTTEPQPKVRLRTPYPRSDKSMKIVNIPEEEHEYPVVFSEEGAMAGEDAGEETGEDGGLGVKGTYDDLYYDSDDDLTREDEFYRCEERSSLSSGRTQVSWPPSSVQVPAYPTLQEPGSQQEDAKDVGRSAFYTSDSRRQSSGSDTYRYLLRIREGVKIFFIHNDGVITSPWNKPFLSVTKDRSRDWMIGEGLTVSVGSDLWKCDLNSKATLVLKSLQGVYIFRETFGKPDCCAVGVRVPGDVRKAQHELLHNILRENTLMEEERPTGITKTVSKGASSAATRVNKMVDHKSAPTSMAFVRRSSMRALKGVSKRLTTLAEKTGSNLKELPEEYSELQKAADILRFARSAKMVQYI